MSDEQLPTDAAGIIAGIEKHGGLYEFLERNAYGEWVWEKEVTKVVLAALRASEKWRFDNDSVIGGAPVTAGVTIYTFDQRGRWLYDLPPLPHRNEDETR